MKKVSIIVPAYNEEKNIPLAYNSICTIFENMSDKYSLELVFINDGSSDNSFLEIDKLQKNDDRVLFIDFSRNFGKEAATTAGIINCTGDACLMIDADLQHPIELIPEFIKKWEEGFDVVVGVREKNKNEGWVKKYGSILFYKLINSVSRDKVYPNATDFRLIDRCVIEEYKKFTERGRMTRALIDWLGFKRTYIPFNANARQFGKASYNFFKLVTLAFNSFVSQSLLPLKLAGYIGVIITTSSGLLGLYILITRYIVKTNFGTSITNIALLALINVFSIGIVLCSLGLIALYIARINTETQNRPLYVIRKR